MKTTTQRLNTAWIRAGRAYDRLLDLALTRPLTEEELEALLETRGVRDTVMRYEGDVADAERRLTAAAKGAEIVEGILHQIEQQTRDEDQPMSAAGLPVTVYGRDGKGRAFGGGR